ncbi:MAG: ade2 [Firmicutes bacterium]|nr:ade2 [Bacillota bacterium]
MQRSKLDSLKGGITINTVQNIIAVALGECQAELVLKNCQVFNVFTGEFKTGDVAITNGRVAGVGKYSGTSEIDLAGKYVTPGFIDSHVHIESAMVSPGQFAAAVVPAGTTTIAADPHEIANVLGEQGLEYMLAETENIPLNVYIMLPSCVPATQLENSGANLKAGELERFIDHPRVLGLGEMMDYPGVLAARDDIIAKLSLARGKKVDGHAPGLTGKALTAYIAAGIHSDHECMTADEARERLEQGMYVMLRQGSAAKNLLALLPVVNQHTMSRCLLATDDRHPDDLLEQGHINYLVKLAAKTGMDIAWVLKMATINAAMYFGLADIGAVAPGYRADIVVFDNLYDWKPVMVFKDGKLAAENGQPLFKSSAKDGATLRNTVTLAKVKKEKLTIPATSSIARVIGLVPGQLVTNLLQLQAPVRKGEFVAEPAEDILKLAVWERHKGTSQVGVGLLHGLGLKDGAIASTIAHDSHNLVVAGANDDDMLLAMQELQRIHGGICIVCQKKVLGSLSLPIGGLMADQNIIAIRQELWQLLQLARKLGIREEYDPFMTLAFLSLPVIPAVKLTDEGLVDVLSKKLVPVAVE